MVESSQKPFAANVSIALSIGIEAYDKVTDASGARIYENLETAHTNAEQVHSGLADFNFGINANLND